MPISRLKEWTKLPIGIQTHLFIILPLIISQIFQRLFFIVDNRFVGNMGSTILLIHNIQFSILVLGQFIGIAGTTTALILWNRKENETKKSSLISKILAFNFILASLFGLTLLVFRDAIIKHYAIPAELINEASMYIGIGIFNMVLQAIHGTVDGVLIASKQQKLVFILAFVMLAGNIVGDYLAINEIYLKSGSIYYTLVGIGGTSTLLLFLVTLFGYLKIKRNITGDDKIEYKAVAQVWKSEIGIVLIRSAAPLMYPYQVAGINATPGFLVTYNLILHIAYLACLPLSASNQIAVRDASELESKKHEGAADSQWKSLLFYAGILPTFMMLLLSSIFSEKLITFFYQYEMPLDHVIYAKIFFIACAIGQIGHVLAVKIRARKESHVVTRNFLFSEFVMHLGLIQVLLIIGQATPLTLGIVSVAYTSSYVALNFWYSRNKPLTL